MTFNIWTFLLQAVNFLVLAFVLHKLLYGPLQRAIEERRKSNEQARADADKARSDAAALQQRLKAEEADAGQRNEELRAAGRAEAEQTRRKLMADAEEAIRQRRAEFEAELQRERTGAFDMLRDDLVRSAADAAARILQQAADVPLNRQMALGLAQMLESLPAGERERLSRDRAAGEAVVIESAAELDAATRDRLAAAAAAAGGGPPGAVAIRPDLIAGVRLRIGGHVFDASAAGALAQALAAAPEAGRA